MKRKIPRFSKLSLCIFISIFALSFISLNGDGGFLKIAIAQTADFAIGPAIDNPGIRTAMDVQSRHSDRIMGIPGVVGHGIGISSDGEPVIKIFVERAGISRIPVVLEGVQTKVEVTGMIVAYADPTARFARPVPIGVSTGHPDITAGTIGCRVTDDFNVFALSNNHVYANGNDASIGNNALQPGPYDGGVDPADAIGYLYDFEPINFSGGTNTIDAAIALSSIYDLSTSTPPDGYGRPGVITVPADIGQNVQKYGRTTGLTQGTVAELNVTVDVCYQTKGPFRCVKAARFVDQISITPGTFSAGGDSGSLIVTDDENKYPIGLLFAGSTTRTIANPIDLVLERFDVTVDDTEDDIPPANYPPNADFSFIPNGFTVDFNDESTDSDGSVVSWAWDFGDGSTSIADSPSHTYSADGTYTVSLTVTDNAAGTDSISKDVTVSSGGSGAISLTATWKLNRNWLIVDLDWSGAISDNVDIYRGDTIIVTTTNDGAYTDKISNNGVNEYYYQVCQEGSSSICSSVATVP